MKQHIFNNHCSARKGAQITLLFASSLMAILALMGLALDCGMMFADKGRLNKAVDASALAATKNLAKTDEEIRQIVQNIAKANYIGTTYYSTIYAQLVSDIDSITKNSSPGIYVEIDRTVRYPAVLVDVKMVAQHYTHFMRIFPIDNFKVMPMMASAQAIRYPLIVGIVIDRSGSMSGNGGEDTIRSTIPQFLDYFDEKMDYVGIYSYATAGYREMSFRTNFVTTGSDIVTDTTKLKFGGYTCPSEGIRACLDDMQGVTGFNDAGVKKVIVFLTDGQFNSFRTRPANTMGAFNDPPSGMTAAAWSNIWFTNTSATYPKLFYSTLAAGAVATNCGRPHTVSGGITNYNNSVTNSGSEINYSAGNTNVTITYAAVATTLRCTNLDVIVCRDSSSGTVAVDALVFPYFNETNAFKFGRAIAAGSYSYYWNSYTNASKAGYPGGDSLSNTKVQRIDKTSGFGASAIYRYNDKPTFATYGRFISTVDGTVKTMAGNNIQAQADDYAKRYCKVARKTTTASNKILVITIGFSSSPDAAILKAMANVSGSAAPYTAVDSTQPYDDTYGYTGASNSSALNRTYNAIGLYLATRLTK